MQLKDIFAKEQSRETDVHYRTIYLVPEGTFYRAYEWSAWLCHRCVSQFKPTHRLLKNTDESIVFVGFPQTSLERYTPEGATISVGEDKVVEMVLADDLLVCDMTVEDLKQDFENWKSCVPTAKSRVAYSIAKHQSMPTLSSECQTQVSVQPSVMPKRVVSLTKWV